MQICPNCGEENPPRFRLCGFCGTALAPPLPPQEVRKIVTVVFSDLKGSTSLGEALDSEALREVMSRYFDEMRAVLEAHGGTVEKYIGDAIMAVFGLPRIHEDDALRAVRAAHSMQRALATLNDELEQRWGVRLTNRTGVNTGEVVAGDPTTGQRLVTGDTVNVAARLEQAAPALEVLIGEPTYRLVRDAVEVEGVEPLELKGKSERVPAYRLLSVAADREGVVRRSEAPMVGRDTELTLLVEACEVARHERRCHTVSVLGEAGVGKSRLAAEFVQRVGGDVWTLRGRCLPYGDGITFWPLVEAVREGAGISERDQRESARKKLTDLVGPGHEDVVARIASAVGLSETQFPVEELFWGVRRLFALLAERRPLIVIFEDLHWAETVFLDLIEHLTVTLVDAPVMLLCDARPTLLEQRPGWSTQPNAARVVLEPLTTAESERVVENLLGEAGLDQDVRRRIVAAAEGNPLFVEQLLSMMIDEGLIQFTDGRWTAPAELPDVTIPPTIQALLAARLDALEREERAVIEPASVVGYVFPEDAVRELAPESVQGRTPALLGTLARKQLVQPDPMERAFENAHRFRHVLIRETTYDGLLKRARAALHEQFVVWADRVNGDRAMEYDEILGYHLEQAYRYLSELGPLDDHGRALGTDGARRLASAGHRAFGRGDMPAAANLLHRAGMLLPEGERARLELLPELGEAMMETGEFTSAQAVLDEAVEGAVRLGDERLEADATLTRLFVRHRLVDELETWSEEILEAAARVIPVLDRYGAHPELAKAWRLVGFVHGSVCRWPEQVEAVRNAIHHARLGGDTRLEARLVAEYATGLRDGPMPVAEAISHSEQALDAGLADRQAEALVLCCLARLRGMQGQFDLARELVARAERLRDELGPNVIVPRTSLASSHVEMMAGDPAAAERVLRRDYEKLSAMGERYALPLVTALLARAVCAQGRYDEAVGIVALAAESADAHDVETQAICRCVSSELAAREGRLDEAEQLATQALELYRRSDSPEMTADCLIALAKVLANTHPDEAFRALREALELYEVKGNVVSAARARAAADDLLTLSGEAI